MQDIITVNHLSKSYGSHQVLNDISFSFQPGQIIALLGPNGSGKSSLIKILTGLIHDYSGEVLIDGEVPGPSTKAKIAYLPEKSYLADWMRAVDAINYIADFYPDFDRDKAMRMLDTFGLQPKQDSTMLISTHLIHDVESIFDHALMIGQGKVLLNSSVDDICSSGKTLEDVFKEVFKYAWQID